MNAATYVRQQTFVIPGLRASAEPGIGFVFAGFAKPIPGSPAMKLQAPRNDDVVLGGTAGRAQARSYESVRGRVDMACC